MEVREIGMADLKRNLAEEVNRAAHGRERIVLLSRGKPKAALVSLDDLRRLEQAEGAGEGYRRRQEQLLREARQLRQKIALAGVEIDSVAVLAETRQERMDDLTGLR